MNWSNVSLVVLGLSALAGAFLVALWISLVIWTFRDMRSRSRDAFAQLLAALMVFVLGPLGALLYLLLRPRETLAEKYERSLEEEALLQDIEERQICPGCKQPIEDEYVVCPICHIRLRQPCAHCGKLIHPRWGICPYCATSQKALPGVEAAGRVTLADLEREEALAAVEAPAALRARVEEFAVDLDTELDTFQGSDEEWHLEEEEGGEEWHLEEEDGSEAEEMLGLYPGSAPSRGFEADGDDVDPAAGGESPDDEDEAPASGTADPTDSKDDETPRRPLWLFRRP
jgi:RNA polymerase subunit RPABC4/transcription elongation factor Spt4